LQVSLVNSTHESGVGLRSRPRIAKQSRKIRQMAGRACSYQTAVGFFMAPDGSLQSPIGQTGGNCLLMYTSLFARMGVQRAQAGPLAQSSRARSARKTCPWAGFQRRAGRKAPDAEASNVLPPFKFLFITQPQRFISSPQRSRPAGSSPSARCRFPRGGRRAHGASSGGERAGRRRRCGGMPPARAGRR